MDIHGHTHEEEISKLPSEAMQREFELWNEEYTLNALTDLTSSQIESRKLRFENRVHRLVAEHNPGRLIEEDPFLAHSAGKPPYDAKQWERARKIIWNEAEKVSLRFDQAEGIVREDEKNSKQKWYVKLAEAAIPDSIKLR